MVVHKIFVRNQFETLTLISDYKDYKSLFWIKYPGIVTYYTYMIYNCRVTVTSTHTSTNTITSFKYNYKFQVQLQIQVQIQIQVQLQFITTIKLQI